MGVRILRGNTIKGQHDPQLWEENGTLRGALRGRKLFYLQLELFYLQLSFFAYSPLRRFLDALSHCKHKSSNCK